MFVKIIIKIITCEYEYTDLDDPCVAIITSASSKTKTDIWFKLKNLNLIAQSKTFPGVPIMMCSVIFDPRLTGISKNIEGNYP